MTTADLMLYRRMRGIFWGLLVFCVVGIPLLTSLAWTIPSHLEWYNDGFIEEVGAPDSIIASGISFAGIFSLIASVILGATAGSVDLQRGVLRDLVLAGKARWRVVVGRLAAATTWLVAAFLAAIAVSILIALTAAPLDESITWEDHWWAALSFWPMIVVSLSLAAGVAMLIGSRGPSIAVYFGIVFLVDNILGALPKVGEWWREISLGLAQEEMVTWVEDGAETFQSELGRSATGATLVLVGWLVVPFVLGLLRLSRRDL